MSPACVHQQLPCQSPRVFAECSATQSQRMLLLWRFMASVPSPLGCTADRLALAACCRHLECSWPDHHSAGGVRWCVALAAGDPWVSQCASWSVHIDELCDADDCVQDCTYASGTPSCPGARAQPGLSWWFGSEATLVLFWQSWYAHVHLALPHADMTAVLHEYGARCTMLVPCCRSTCRRQWA